MRVQDTQLVQKTTALCAAHPMLAGISFDPISMILSLLAPWLTSLVSNCFNPDPSPTPTPPTPADVKARLVESYKNGQYSLDVQAPTVTHAMHLARDQGNKIKRYQARVIAIQLLDQTRTADASTVGECLMACHENS